MLEPTEETIADIWQDSLISKGDTIDFSAYICIDWYHLALLM